MFKKFFAVFLILIFSFGGGVSALAAETVCLDINMVCGEKAYEFNGFNVGGRVCLRLQDLSTALNGSRCGFSASVDSSSLTAIIKRGSEATETDLFVKSYITAPSVESIKLNLKADSEDLTLDAYLIDGEIFCEVRSLGGILMFDPVYNSENKSIDLYSGGWLTAEIISERSALKIQGKPICLTFDDGPSYTSTERYIKALSAVGGHGTFFVVGERAEEYPELIKAIYDSGNQLGNHTYSHPQLTSLSTEAVVRQINSTSNAVYNACGTYTYIARPPYGAINSVVKTAVNIPFFNWSVDTLDWKYRNADYVYNQIMNGAEDGAVILLHDLYATSAAAVERAVPELAAKGYIFVTIDEMAQSKGGYDKVLGYVK